MTDLLDTTLATLRASLPLLLTVAEAAELARCSPSSVRRAIADGRLPYNQRRAGGVIYVPRDAVLAWAFSIDIARRAAPIAASARQASRRDAPARAPKPRQRRPPLRLTVSGAAPERLTPEGMRAFAAAYPH